MCATSWRRRRLRHRHPLQGRRQHLECRRRRPREAVHGRGRASCADRCAPASRPRHRHDLDDRHPDRRERRDRGHRVAAVDAPSPIMRTGRRRTRSSGGATAAPSSASCWRRAVARPARSPASASPACCRPSCFSMRDGRSAPPRHAAERRARHRRNRGHEARHRRRRFLSPYRRQHQPAAGGAEAALDRAPRAAVVRADRDGVRFLRLHHLAAHGRAQHRAELGARVRAGRYRDRPLRSRAGRPFRTRPGSAAADPRLPGACR